MGLRYIMQARKCRVRSAIPIFSILSVTGTCESSGQRGLDFFLLDGAMGESSRKKDSYTLRVKTFMNMETCNLASSVFGKIKISPIKSVSIANEQGKRTLSVSSEIEYKFHLNPSEHMENDKPGYFIFREVYLRVIGVKVKEQGNKDRKRTENVVFSHYANKFILCENPFQNTVTLMYCLKKVLRYEEEK
ncbi:hypothetical protein MJT46_001326 [Ovis ammon polii x Ovis aries]|nr:hypothetical protein MJT46_001326 [Ovis ammon polii x Ovis aries]